MSRETKPFKPDPKRDDGEVRHYYDDSEITADFDVSEELTAHEASYAARKVGGKSSTVLAARVRKLKAEVGQGGMTLADAEKLDAEAYNECFTALEGLRKRYLTKPENQPAIGVDYYQATVMVTAESGHGKGPLADGLLREVQVLAAHGGAAWSIARPAGRNAVEGIRGSELVLHDDARYWMLPTHDEFYRYLDANRASESDTRFSPTPGVAPRVAALTTSNTLYEFALTVVARKPSDKLAEEAEGSHASELRPRDINEVLRRIGWCVEPRTPGWVLEQEGRLPFPEFLALLQREVVVQFSRLRKTANTRVEDVHGRDGSLLGRVSTDRELELVAVIKGMERANRFLASSVMAEYSPDVSAEIPAEVMRAYTDDHLAVAQELREIAEAKKIAELTAAIARAETEAACLAECGTADSSGSPWDLTDCPHGIRRINATAIAAG